MYYDDLGEPIPKLSTEEKNNLASYDLGRHHAWKGQDEDLSHCLGPDSETQYKMGYKRGTKEIENQQLSYGLNTYVG